MEVSKSKSEEDQLLSPCNSEVDNFFGDPQVFPPVGEEYQAKVPSLSPSDDDLKSKPHLAASKGSGNEEGLLLSNMVCPVLQADGINTHLGVENCLENSHQLDLGDGSNNLPALNSWADADYNSFLLGLYTFGKDFNLVKRFVKSKQMGDILLFYYGKFYGSSGFRRWSDCRKVKSRRCVSGQKIYSGWRLQELLSRLSYCVSVVCQALLIEDSLVDRFAENSSYCKKLRPDNAPEGDIVSLSFCGEFSLRVLMEMVIVFQASRMFEQGSTPFEDFVFALKEMVGTANLVAAVGIGTGKQDLTNTAESSRKYNALPARPEIPVGEAWSSLSPMEIIKFLRGDFRLSKARLNDLFWEAVWPRLLAKGWHSEQPKDHGVSGSKHSLVFLIPGIQEFTRDSLMKGNDYFDSVTDILNKVASDPVLLELHREAEGVIPVDGLRNKPSTMPDMNGAIKRPSHQYLQPRIPKGSFNSMMFMIVDTSLISIGKSTVRELRHLPDVAAHSFDNHRKRRVPCEGSDANHKSSSISKIEESSLDQRASSESSSCFTPDDTDRTKSCHEQDVKKLQPTLLKTHRKNWEMKSSGRSNEGVGIKAEQQNSATLLPEPVKAEIDDISGRKRRMSKPSRSASSLVKSKEMVLSLAASRSFTKTNLLRDGSKDETTPGKRRITSSTSLDGDRIWPMIDLNLPQVYSDLVAEEPSTPERGPSSLTASPSPSNEAKLSNCASTTVLPLKNCWRQSTRNRPLTMRALEAIECGLFDTRKNRKRKKYTKSANRLPYIETSNQPATSDDGRIFSTADLEELGGCENEATVAE